MNWSVSAHVKLCATVCLGDVQGDRLHTDEVLAAWQVPGDSECHLAQVLGRPTDALPPISDSGDLVDFEPNSARSVPVGDISTARCFRHIDVDNSRMVDCLVAGDSKLRAGGL